MHRNYRSETIAFPLFDTQTIEAKKPIECVFFLSPNKKKYMSNLACSGFLPKPQRYKLAGISASILDSPILKNDHDILDKCFVQFEISCKSFLQIPLRTICYNAISIEDLSEIYDLFQEWQDRGIEEIKRERTRPEINPDIYLFLPIKKENDFVIIESNVDFRATIRWCGDDQLENDATVMLMLHGYLERPIC